MGLSEIWKIISERNIIGLWIFIISLNFFINFYPEIPKFKHPRWAIPILISSILFGLIFTSYLKEVINQKVFISLIILYLFYLVFAFYTKNHIPFPETIPISNAEIFIREGKYKGFKSYYPKKPIYITSVPGKIKWLQLNISNSISQIPPKFKEAYIYSDQILNLPLFENEKKKILLDQVLILLMLGDTKRSKEIFEVAKKMDDESKNSEILNLESHFLEREGKFEEARQNLLSAISKFNNNEKNKVQRAIVYNNLARMEMMLKNSTNTQHYYRKSLSIAVETNEKSYRNKIQLEPINSIG